MKPISCSLAVALLCASANLWAAPSSAVPSGFAQSSGWVQVKHGRHRGWDHEDFDHGRRHRHHRPRHRGGDGVFLPPPPLPPRLPAPPLPGHLPAPPRPHLP